jgi:hypothetical protein
MERVKWTDDLLDERMTAIDKAFDRQSEELRLLREEMRADFAELRSAMRAGFAELRAELAAVHRQLVLVLTAFGVGVLGLLGAQTL